MRKLARIAVLVAIVIIVSGCTIRSEAEVVEGPLAGVRGVIASVEWNGSGTGRLEVVMPDGEVCGGRYFTGSWLKSSELVFGLDLWARCFGSQFDPWFMQHGVGMLTGDYGRLIRVEYFVSANNVGYGLGDDNQGNVFRFVLKP